MIIDESFESRTIEVALEIDIENEKRVIEGALL